LTEAPGPDIALHGVTKRFGAHVAVDDVVTNFNAGQTVTFPLFIYGAGRQGVPPQVNVLATAPLLGVLGLMVLNVVLQRRLAQRDAPGLRAAPAPA
jgi:spermidine/putrescine transport system permease protein